MPLTNDLIKAAAPGAVLRDDKVPGLHCRVFANSRAFYLRYRTKGGIERKPKLGEWPTLSLTAARRIAGEMLEQVAAGQDPSRVRQEERAAPIMRELADRYMRAHGDRKKSGKEDRRMWDQYVLPALGGRKVADIRVVDVEDLLADLAPTMANRVRSLLSKAFNLAIKWEMATRNPTTGTSRNPERKRRRYLSAEEAALLADRLRSHAAAKPQAVAFIWLLIYTGARPSELAAAKPSDLKGNAIVLREHKTDGTGDDRVVHLPPQALAILAGLPKGDTLLGIQNPRRLWETILDETGIQNLRLYDLRHSFASLALAQGYTLGQIGELLGHRSTQTTSRYAHLIDEAAKEAAGRTADAFDAFAKPKLRVVN